MEELAAPLSSEGHGSARGVGETFMNLSYCINENVGQRVFYKENCDVISLACLWAVQVKKKSLLAQSAVSLRKLQQIKHTTYFQREAERKPD